MQRLLFITIQLKQPDPNFVHNIPYLSRVAVSISLFAVT